MIEYAGFEIILDGIDTSAKKTSNNFGKKDKTAIKKITKLYNQTMMNSANHL